MPDRSFGRTVRYRRTKLGLSQAQLGDLVGRSPSTIRSWERDKSAPNEVAVLHALAAVLGVDERSLFEKAGQEPPPDIETSPTVEEALATLRPETHLRDEPPPSEQSGGDVETTEEEGAGTDDEAVSSVQTQIEVELSQLGEPEPDMHGSVESMIHPVEETRTDEQNTSRRLLEPVDARYDEPERIEPVAVRAMTRSQEPGYVAPPDPFLITTPTPPLVEPSYMEDQGQRQIYRVRTLATLVAVVALAIALVWALGEGLDSLGSWWDAFFGNLRL